VTDIENYRVVAAI